MSEKISIERSIELVKENTLSSVYTTEDVIKLLNNLRSDEIDHNDMADTIASELEDVHDRRCIVDKTSASFDIGNGNEIELDEVSLDNGMTREAILEGIERYISNLE